MSRFMSYDFKRLALSVKGLSVFTSITEDQAVKAFCKLLNALSAETLEWEKIYIRYHEFYNSLAVKNWLEYLIELLLSSEDEFAVLAAEKGLQSLNGLFLERAKRDLLILQDISRVNSVDIIEYLVERLNMETDSQAKRIFAGSISPEKWPVWENMLVFDEKKNYGGATAVNWLNSKKKELKQEFINENDWSKNILRLAEFYKQVGNGILSSFTAFRWSEQPGGGLEGIDNPDPIRLKNLIGQEREQSIILKNTEHFLAGYPANNIILYGNRGTGKSSLVKALLNEYVSWGLRLVQLRKSQIGDFPKLVLILSRLPCKFIVFIDDLSFDDLEQDYKDLKSLLEGGVEARPQNVLIYATSNRRNLVRETFSERAGDEVHARDNIEEKLSLADRFGITVTFLTPDQETYLKIVEGLAEQQGIEMDKDELRQRALKWVMMYNGRSGRTAKQFIDYLMGELKILRPDQES